MPETLRQFAWPTVAGLLLALVLILAFPGQLGLPQLGPDKQNGSFASTVAAASPSVVNIYTSKQIVQRHPMSRDPFFRYLHEQGLLGQQEQQVQNSLGSGVIVDERGYILTNHHVVANVDHILVSLYDGRGGLATIVGTDPETDLAVLKIEMDGLTPIPFGQPELARVGDVVLAIGNPFGFSHTVTQGIISAKGRYGLDNLGTYQNFLQTDASINPGNSGGALVDSTGKLLGINSAIYGGGAQGIGLAIPADLAMNVLKSIISQGRVIRGWLGVGAEPLNPILARQQGIDVQGVLVTNTYRDGPADSGGLRPGDIITHINGQAIVDGRSGLDRVAPLKPGEIARVSLWRDGVIMELPVTVGTRPAQR